MNAKTLILTLVALATTSAAACGDEDKSPFETAESQPLGFVTHVDVNLIEQDVFVVGENDASVVRVTAADLDPATMAAPIYAADQAIPHDPFGLGAAPMGPFGRGLRLGPTLEQWLAATGDAVYDVSTDGRVRLEGQFENLVADGVYTLWCSRLRFPPNVSIVDMPCGELDGSTNTVVADAEGRLTFSIDTWVMPETTVDEINVVALAWHSDGRTWGPSPGDFGLNSHVQIIAMFPAASAE